MFNSFQLQERLETPPALVEPVCCNICEVAEEISYVYEVSKDINARQLSALLRKSNFKALLEIHDIVAKQRKYPPSVPSVTIPTMPSDERTEAIRVVGLRRQLNEPLVCFQIH